MNTPLEPADGEEILRLPEAPAARIGPWRLLIDFDDDRRSGAYHVGYSIEADGRVLYAIAPADARRYPEDA